MNELKRIAEFQKVLADYQPSEVAKKVLHDTRLVLLVGPSGGGRNTIINRLVAVGPYDFIVSDTTRAPAVRDGKLEQNGVQYFFRTEDELLADLQTGGFLEAEIIHNQQVSGTSIRELVRVNKSGKIAVHELEYGGADKVVQIKSDIFVIGVLPPSFEEWQSRWAKREQLHSREFFNRMQTAEKVLRNMLTKPYFKLVINDSVDGCVQEIRDIVERGNYNPELAEQSREVAQAILERVEATLKEKD